MRDNAAVEGLLAAVQRYFDLMYDCDVSKFAKVFWTTAQLHGFRDGKMTVWPHDTYKDVLSKR
jgi:Putative lumazine-binding